MLLRAQPLASEVLFQLAEVAVLTKEDDAALQATTRSTGPDHVFEFDEADIFARGISSVSLELFESWSFGWRSTDRRTDLPRPYSADLAVETIELLLREKYNETEDLVGDARIIQLLKFCLKTYFTFDGTICKQVKGTPVRSPISGLIAESVLQQLESLVFRHHRPKFWARYVDDTFVVIERDQVLTFKEHLNAVFPDIQFTMEEEENNQLAFQDALVCRKDDGGLKTKVFRKATNTEFH
ncbi:hypothetical protein SprV_0702281300 [Sparganum proliferum]